MGGDARRLALADVGLIGLDGLALATERAGITNFLAHGLADAVSHEPSGLVGHAEHAV